MYLRNKLPFIAVRDLCEIDLLAQQLYNAVTHRNTICISVFSDRLLSLEINVLLHSTGQSSSISICLCMVYLVPVLLTCRSQY